MSDTLATLKTRRSCRAYKPDPVEKEKLQAILKKLGIQGDYEGIGHLVLDYGAKPAGQATPRKEHYIYEV